MWTDWKGWIGVKEIHHEPVLESVGNYKGINSPLFAIHTPNERVSQTSDDFL